MVKDIRGIGDNSKIGYDNQYNKLKKAYDRLRDIFCDRLSLSMELQKDDLEDVRVSTRVADRFKNLEVATMHNEHVRDTINPLKRVAYSNKPIDKWEARLLRKELGNDIADYELARRGYVEEDNNE